jgi:sigma-B regulation protein RsbU (phosphoserine phosphatase)
VTLFLGQLELASGRLTFVNAGHLPPLLARADGGLERLEEGGPVLGLLPQAAYVSGQTHLGPGDLLLLYSDGVLEAADASGTEFGEARIAACARRALERPAAEVVADLAASVRRFSEHDTAADDLTVVAVRLP